MASDQSSRYIEFTDQQRTRVVSRDTLDGDAQTTPSIGNTQAFARQKEGLLDGLSVAQIVAGAAAAATSMVLSSKIGIAGSVIGAAVSSVVTVVSSQLYRRFLTASAEKIKHTSFGNQVTHATSNVTENRDGVRASETNPSSPATTKLYTAQSGMQTTSTPIEGADDAAKNASASSDASCAATRVAPEYLQRRAQAERSSTQRKVIGFSIVAAVVAVIICAIVILIGTAGEGLGERTALFSTISTITEDSGETANDASTKSRSSTTNANSTAATTDSSTEQAIEGDGSSSDTANASTSQNTSTTPSTSTNSNSAAQSPDTSESSSSSSSSGSDASESDSSGSSSGTSSDSSSTSQSPSSDTTQDSVS